MGYKEYATIEDLSIIQDEINKIIDVMEKLTDFTMILSMKNEILQQQLETLKDSINK